MALTALTLPIFGIMHHVAIFADQCVRPASKESTRHVHFGGSPWHVPGLSHVPGPHEPPSGETDLRSFRHGTNPSAWLLRIMSNTRISAHQRIRRRPPESRSGRITDGQLANCDRHASTALRPAKIEALPDGHRIILYYNAIGRFRFEAIAEITSIPTGTVMPRLHRARAQLRTLLASVTRDRGTARGAGRREAVDLPKPPRALGERQ
jgi:RNA polymerase sigma-70 factor, ECF subfamily